ncbi:hypothetical protein D3C77_649240 [compost metagenome]
MLTNDPLIEHQLAYRFQAVTQVGDPDLQTGYPVIFRAALFDTLTALDAIIHQGRAHNVVGIFFQYGIDYALNLN